MANVHVHSGELYLPHHTPAVDRVGHGMEQAVAETGVFKDASLVFAQAVVAFSCRNSAPDHRGKLISADLFPGEVCTLLAYSWVLVFSSLVLRVSSCLALMSMTVAWPAQWLWADLHILVS